MQFSGIQITPEHLLSLYDHAENSLPNESVALLFGTIQDGIARVSHIEPVNNTAVSPSRFEVDPVTEYNLLIQYERFGIRMVGIFHSHPAPPRPSERDVENMRLNPVIWLIASKSTGSWSSHAFYLKGDEVTEVPCIKT